MPRYAFGRRPPKDAPALRFSAVRRAVPAYPAAFDSIAGIGGWEMLGNDAYGDCVAVTWATVRRIVTLAAGTEDYPGLDQVLAVYRTQNPRFDPNSDTHGPGSADDGGMDIQTLLELLVVHGGPDGVRAVAFAKVDHTNAGELKAALATFRFLWLGVTVTQQNEDAFPGTWTRTGTALGGHSITGTGYDQHQYLMQTWAEEGSLSVDYVTAGNGRAGVEEAWVVLWPEHAAHLTAEQRDTFDAAFYDLTGKHVDWPTPAPTPSPVPAPVPSPTPNPAPSGDSAFADAVRRLLSLKWVPQWFRRAATAWLDSL